VYHFGESLHYDYRSPNIVKEWFRRRASNCEDGPRGFFGLVT
jgi:hypothetical protein